MSDELFKELEGFQPEIVEDEDMDFKPMKGCYVCRIDSITRRQGTAKASGEPYDFYSGKFVVLEVVSGDKGVNRRLDISYNNDADGLKKLANDLFTAGLQQIDFSSQEKLDQTLALAVDGKCNVRAWVWKEKEKQMCKVVKEFKVKKEKATVAKDTDF